MNEIEVIQKVIFCVRGTQVILDRDLARYYMVETKRLNEIVKRNIDRFPNDFMFRLTKEEYNSLRSQIATSNLDSLYYDDSSYVRENSSRGGVRYLPYVFTEQGVAQVSAVLKSKVAIQAHISITRAFVSMRTIISSNAGLFQRIESLERHQLETDQKIDRVLDCLEEGTIKKKAHIFSAGHIYEAKAFITELISHAKNRVILIDGYISSSTIDLLDARSAGVPAKIYTCSIGQSMRTLCDLYNSQYPTKPLELLKWHNEQHDRWLILDDELWHCGASIKDAGAKTFGIDPIGLDVNLILQQI